MILCLSLFFRLFMLQMGLRDADGAGSLLLDPYVVLTTTPPCKEPRMANLAHEILLSGASPPVS